MQMRTKLISETVIIFVKISLLAKDVLN